MESLSLRPVIEARIAAIVVNDLVGRRSVVIEAAGPGGQWIDAGDVQPYRIQQGW